VADALPTLPKLDAGELFRRYGGRVSAWANRLGGPGLDVQDAVQEVFVVAHRKLPEFRGEAQVNTWLYRITEKVVNHQRRKQRWLRFWQPLDGESEAARLASHDRSAPDQLAQADAERRLYEALDKVRERYRTVLILYEIDGRSGEEIAELMGIKVPQVWVVLHRARAALQAQLSAGGAQDLLAWEHAG
jgi:RNA polymerase sigma-70 factor (ECF subfamily)